MIESNEEGFGMTCEEQIKNNDRSQNDQEELKNGRMVFQVEEKIERQS